MLSLIRVRTYGVQELAPSLRDAVEASRSTLKRRYSPGTIRRLGGTAADTEDYVYSLIREDGIADHQRLAQRTYVVVEEGSLSVVGLASLSRKVSSRIQRLPLPPRVTDKAPFEQLHPNVKLGDVNVTGWTVQQYDSFLSEVYAGLLQEIPGQSAWTIEPIHSDATFHEAIIRSGMLPVARPTRYDVGEARNLVPPVSQAYQSAF